MSNSPDKDATLAGVAEGDAKQGDATDIYNATLSQAADSIEGLSGITLNQLLDSRGGLEATASSIRYKLGDEIARGGMGVVHRGRDQRLGRDLAIKVLHDSQQENAASVQRFVEEAQIGGQLQHPGIVPVYDLGQLATGQPFLAMKLVKGETLATLFSNRTDPADDRMRFLGIFEQVCQTLAYAHAKSVIHRDLKPANIMVGAFGEVQVMDWGLAKVLTRNANTDTIDSLEQNKTVIQTIRSFEDGSGRDSASHTQSGSIIGTLAYMPPEQALGQVELLDARADVFALGAILSHLLTGLPPYVAKDSAQLHRMAIKCDLTDCFARLDRSDCDRELKEIVKGCLSDEPRDRFLDAGAVSKLVSAYLGSVSERLRVSELHSAANEARAIEAVKTATSERKRRRVTGVLAGLAIAFLFAAAGTGLWMQKNRSELAKATSDAKLNELLRNQEIAEQSRLQERRVSEELAIAESLLEKANTDEPSLEQLTKAHEASKRAQSIAGTSGMTPNVLVRYQALTKQHEQLTSTLALLNELDSIRINAIERALQQKYVTIFSSKAEPIGRFENPLPTDQVAAAFQHWGMDFSESAEATATKIQSQPDWAYHPIAISLRLWHHALNTQSAFEQKMQWEWTLLANGKAKSAGGATLTELEDHSILASGKNPNCDIYEFDFPLQHDDFTALRIEALPHKSLPNRGLGRNKNGDAAMTDLKVFLVDESSHYEEALTIESAEADFCYQAAPLTVNSWNLTYAIGIPRTAIFTFKQPLPQSIHSDRSPKRLRIVIKNHNLEEWGDQNLGRLRFSVDSVATHGSAHGLRKQLAGTVAHLPLGSWQERYWTAAETNDITALLELADDEQASKQPDAYLILLAERLNELGEQYHAKRLLDGATWHSSPPTKMSARATLVPQTDGSILATGSHDSSDTYRLEWPEFGDSDGSPVAFRIETFDDGIDGGVTRSTETTSAEITDIRFYFWNAQTMTIQSRERISCEHQPTLGGQAYMAIDGDFGTSWKIRHPVNVPVCSAIIKLKSREDAKFDGRVLIYISNGQWINNGSNSTLRRFRVAWTYELPEDVVDPRDVAMQILRRAYLKDPTNERLILAMARQMLFQATPDFQESMGYATAAVSLSPDNPATLKTFIQLALLQQPNPDDALYQRAVGLARRCDEVTGSTEVVSSLAGKWLEIARRQFSGRNMSDAANAYLEAYRLDPAGFHNFDQIGVCLDSSGNNSQAEHFYQLGLKFTPKDDWTPSHYGELLATRGDFDKANEMFDLSLSLNATNEMTLSRKACLLAFQGRYEEAKSTLDAYLNVGGTRYYTRLLSSLTRAQLGQKREALTDLETDWSKQMYGPAIRDILLLTMELDGEDAMKQRFKSGCSAISYTPDLLDRGIRQALTRIVGVYRSFPNLSNQNTFDLHSPKHFPKLSALLIEQDPTNASFQRIHAFACLHAERWEEAKLAAETAMNLENPLGAEGYIVALVLYHQGEPEAAAQEYLKATELTLDSANRTDTLDLVTWMRAREDFQAVASLAKSRAEPREPD